MGFIPTPDRCTTISAIKLWDFQRIQGLKEAYYESVTLSIWSISEVSVGIVVANLPPLRKSFDGFFKHVLSGSINTKLGISDNSNLQSFKLPSYGSKRNSKGMPDGANGRSVRLNSTATGDDMSDKTMLGQFDFDDSKHGSRLVRSTQVTLDRESWKDRPQILNFS
jgi:hypothetical protein